MKYIGGIITSYIVLLVLFPAEWCDFAGYGIFD